MGLFGALILPNSPQTIKNVMQGRVYLWHQAQEQKLKENDEVHDTL